MSPSRRRKKKVNIPVEDDYLQKLINRIEECEAVVSEIDNSRLWNIVRKDMEAERQRLDDSWQNIIEGDRLQKARELKMAVMHILELKNKYQDELTKLKSEINTYRNTAEEIPKDYDLETNMENEDGN